MAEPADINVDELRRRARRRLVGAVVLALGDAVIVPMLLETEQKPLGEDVSVKIPPVDESKFVNRLSENRAKEGANAPAKSPQPAKDDAPAPATAAPPAVTQPPPKYDTRISDAATSNAPSTPAASATGQEAPTGTAALPATSAAANGSKGAPPAPHDGFAVQLAAFADDKGANALAGRLKKAGYAAYTEPLKTSKGTLWRVRVGPYPSREAAVAARDKLKTEGQSGIVAAVK
jgi:DedD protein